jgi:flagellar motility protein MotE (MotC chaperone)
MSTFRKFLALFTSARKAQQTLSVLDAKVNKAIAEGERQRRESSAQLAGAKEALTKAQEAHKKARDTVNQQLITIRTLEETLTAVREELNTCQNITIPGLVAAHQNFIARWEAETQVHVSRTAAMQAGQNPGDS